MWMIPNKLLRTLLKGTVVTIENANHFSFMPMADIPRSTSSSRLTSGNTTVIQRTSCYICVHGSEAYPLVRSSSHHQHHHIHCC